MIIISKRKRNTVQEEKVLGFEIVRLNIREMEKDTATFSMTKRNLNENKIKIRSSEVVRIVTAFNPDNLKRDDSKYSFVKDLVILKIGKSYKKYYETLCEKKCKDKKNKKAKKDLGVFTLKIIDIDEKGKITELETIRYKRLLCGSSFVRNQKELYIREELYNSVMEVLLTGILPDAKFPISKVAKFSTYLGLASTDSKPVSMPNICVVKDFTKKVKDAFDIVKQIKTGDNSYKYEVINFADTLEETEELVNCFDGAGIVSYERAAIWAKELGLNYVPSSFQIRVLNGIKGNLYTFPVTEYIEYLEENGLEKNLEVRDLWNTLVNIKEQKIDVFLTESQFKFHSMYKSFEEWKEAFDTDVKYGEYSYERTFNVSEVSRNISKLKDEIWSAYQPLQTLDLSDDELKELAEPTVSMAKKLYTDMDEFIKYRGIAIESDVEESNDEEKMSYEERDLVPWYYKGLALDDSLQYDPYIRKKIKHDLENLQRRIYMGKILLQGNYQTAMPDLLALMEHICGMPVVGALKKGEIYSNYWNIKEVKKVSIWRNPHIACEWINATVVDNDATKRWFKYQTTGIVTDIYGTLPLRLSTMDFDGDTVASVHSDIIYNAVERADIHTIRVEFAKEEKTKEEEFCINDFKKIMNTNKLGFQNNIGDVTNKVTVLWALYGTTTNEEEKKKISRYIKIMSVINQLIIDFVKTGVKVPIPREISQLILKAKKPAFMQNKKGRWVNDNIVISNATNFGYILNQEEPDKSINVIIDEQKKYEMTNGTVDRLYKYLLECMAEIEMKFESSTQVCQFTKLLKDIPYIYNATYPKVKNRLNELMQMHNVICGKKYYDEKESSCIDDSNWRFDRFYSYCEEELLDICSDRKLLLNYLIYLFYADGEFYESDKAILWNVFGVDICNRYIENELCSDDAILKKLFKKEKRAKVKAEEIRKMCSEANLVCIKDLSEKSISITDVEVKHIAEVLSDDLEAQRLMISLLAVYRKINVENEKGKLKKIKLTKGKKNEVTMHQLCKLADIYCNQFYNRLKRLHESKLINIDVENLKIPKITVCIPILAKEHTEYEISDINDVKKITECMFV